MSEKEFDNYMFLGLPRTGKTTFFCTMADNLQDVANNSGGKINLQIMSDTAQKYIESAMDKLHKQEWPDKTQYKLKEDLELNLKYNGLINDYICNFVFHDYPGEAFSEAFNGESDGIFVDDANDLKKRLSSVSGVFLLLSVENLFNDEDHFTRSNAIGGMLRFIIAHNQKAKIAILLNKVELFPEYNHDEMVKLLFNKYKFVNGLVKGLKNRCKFFSVQPLGNNCEINEEGYYVPPQKLAQKDLLVPISWMLGLNLENNIKAKANKFYKNLQIKFNSNRPLYFGIFGGVLVLALWLGYGNWVTYIFFGCYIAVLAIVLYRGRKS